MKIEINKDVCIGCGTCQAMCEECFVLSDADNKAEVLKSECANCDIKEVADSCPVRAIIVTE